MAINPNAYTAQPVSTTIENLMASADPAAARAALELAALSTLAAAPAGTLGGATLASNVLASSLTSVGALTSVAVTGAATVGSLASSGAVSGTTGAFSGAISATNLSGANTGDQTSITGNAGSATVLQTARAINGVNFDGSAAITVTAAAGTLSGPTLAGNVLASSLTSVGTLASLGVTGAATVGSLASAGAVSGTTGTFSNQVNAAGAVVAQAAASGSVLMSSGTDTLTGYLSWRKANDTRLGYFGFSATDVPLTLENGANFTVTGGNVGIGTAAPGYKLDVTGTANVSGAATVGSLASSGAVSGTSGTFAGSGYIRDSLFLQRAYLSHYMPALSFSDTLGGVRGDNVSIGNSGGADTLLHAGGSERVRILGATGNVGIGTADASRRLTVVNNGASTLVSAFQYGAGGAVTTVGASATGGEIQAFTNGYAGGAPLSLNPGGGNVGIGTAAPAARLHVINNGVDGPLFTTSDFSLGTIGSGFGFATGAASGNTHSIIYAFSAGAGAPNNLALQPYGGNVGIGTAAPQRRLHVGSQTAGFGQGYEGIVVNDNGIVQISARNNAANVEIGMFAHSNGNAYLGTWTNSPLILRSNNLDAMTILPSGNVGIGTAAPGQTLDVTGGIVASEDIRTAPKTFGTLRAAATAGNGAHSYITDATLAFIGANIGSAAAGGGANHSPVVVVNGAWVIG